VDKWRCLPNRNDWKVTPETVRLLQHWRHHRFSDIRPFFCQVEAVETAIWLTEVAPKAGKIGKHFIEHIANANNDANPELLRLALKLATGAGKTTVMAMLIVWQTINAVRRPSSKKFTRGFLIVTPGITIRDRLRVLQPNDPDSYYQSRELVPNDMLADLERTKIVITNYHAFKLRERIDLSKGGRSLLQGRGEALNTLETEGQMLQRVIPDLMGMKNIMVLNDEAHHCYREKPGEDDVSELKGDDKKEAQKNNEAARLWISGLEAVNRKLGMTRVIDLSATPFFLRGSGYAEGTLFPWTMNDFSLMDAIECGIVKLPRVPVADNIPGGDMPKFRNLWEHIRTRMPKKGRGKAKTSTRSACRSSCKPPWKPCTDIMKKHTTFGRKVVFVSRPASFWSVIIPPHPNWCTTIYRVSCERMKMARLCLRMAGCHYSGTLTNTATSSAGRTPS
jgi:type III restriction enzyme